MSTPNKQPTFSIIMAVQDQPQMLADHLPALLSQRYEGYEVIVVDGSSTDENADVLKQLKAENPHLYTTFLPKYQFQRDRRRLAFTIGVKAARHEWIVFTDLTNTPPSDQWLMELSEFCSASALLHLGYVNQKNGNVRLRSFESISEARRLISKAERWRAGIGHDRWMKVLQKRANYDFIAVRADHGHELLRLFALDPQMLVPKER